MTPSSIGYDMGTNPVRLKALETARDTGTPTMSGKVNFLDLISVALIIAKCSPDA